MPLENIPQRLFLRETRNLSSACIATQYRGESHETVNLLNADPSILSDVSKPKPLLSQLESYVIDPKFRDLVIAYYCSLVVISNTTKECHPVDNLTRTKRRAKLIII